MGLTGRTGYVYDLGMPNSWPGSGAVLMRLLALLVAAFALRVPVMAQGETTSAIVGSVTDPSGAAIPGATVTVSSSENGLERSVETDDAGRFSFRNSNRESTR